MSDKKNNLLTLKDDLYTLFKHHAGEGKAHDYYQKNNDYHERICTHADTAAKIAEAITKVELALDDLGLDK